MEWTFGFAFDRIVWKIFTDGPRKYKNYKENDGLTTAQLTNQPSYSYWLTQQKRRYDFFLPLVLVGTQRAHHFFEGKKTYFGKEKSELEKWPMRNKMNLLVLKKKKTFFFKAVLFFRKKKTF